MRFFTGLHQPSDATNAATVIRVRRPYEGWRLIRHCRDCPRRVECSDSVRSATCWTPPYAGAALAATEARDDGR